MDPPPCPENWETCEWCGAEPGEICRAPDLKEAKMNTYDEIMSRMREDEIKKLHPQTPPDAIVKPSHYDIHPIDPITFIMVNGFDFATGNVIKYVARAPHKNGLEDLKKARRYLDFLISSQENDWEGQISPVVKRVMDDIGA